MYLIDAIHLAFQTFMTLPFCIWNAIVVGNYNVLKVIGFSIIYSYMFDSEQA